MGESPDQPTGLTPEARQRIDDLGTILVSAFDNADSELPRALVHLMLELSREVLDIGSGPPMPVAAPVRAGSQAERIAGATVVVAGRRQES